MKYRRFLHHLRRTKGWNMKLWLNDKDCIRKRRSENCPITAVCQLLTGKRYDAADVVYAARQLRLHWKTARMIADVADGYTKTTRHRRVRKHLLRATRLA